MPYKTIRAKNTKQARNIAKRRLGKKRVITGVWARDRPPKPDRKGRKRYLVLHRKRKRR